jgi:PAS domain S-box-containing protein
MNKILKLICDKIDKDVFFVDESYLIKYHNKLDVNFFSDENYVNKNLIEVFSKKFFYKIKEYSKHARQTGSASFTDIIDLKDASKKLSRLSIEYLEASDVSGYLLTISRKVLTGGCIFGDKKPCVVRNSLEEVVWVTDLDFNIIDLASHSGKTLGFSNEELLGKSIFEYADKGTSATFKKVLAERLNAINKGEALQAVYLQSQLKNVNGDYEKVEISASFLMNNESEIIAMEGKLKELVKDSSDTEVEINSDSFLRKVWENAVDGFLITDKNARIINCNRGFERITGRPVEDLTGKPITTFYPQRLSNKILDEYKSYFSQDEYDGVRYHLLKNVSGEKRMLETSTDFFNENGEKYLITDVRDISEQVRTLIDAEVKDAKYKELVNNSFDFVLELNHLDKIVFVNNQILEILNYKREELLSKKLKEVIHPEDYKYYKTFRDNPYKNYLSDKIWRFKTGDSRYRKAECNLSFSNNNILIVAQDIEKQQQTESMLADSENRFYSLFNNLSSGVAIYLPVEGGKDFRFVNFNKAAEKYTNVSRNSVIGHTLLEKFPNMSRAPLFEALQEVNRTGALKYLPPFFYKDSVREGWRENFIYKIPSGEIVAIFDDVTARMRSQNELKLINERLSGLERLAFFKPKSIRHLFSEILKEAIKLTNSRWGMVYSFGLHEGIVYSYENEKLVKDSEVDTLTVLNNKVVADVIKEGVDLVSNEKRLNIAGYDLEKLIIMPFLDEDKKTDAVFIISDKGEDYSTADKRQLRLLINSSWKIVEREIAKEELIKSKDKAEESDRLKTAFLQNISHEIRTPLNGIMGFSKMLSKVANFEDKYGEYFNVIINCGDQLVDIVDGIIRISSIEKGLEKIELSEMVLDDICSEIFVHYKEKAESKGITLNLDKSNISAMEIIADREKLKLVIENLLSNALKYTSEGEIFLSCEKTGTFLEFSVKDTGIGIKEDHYERIFDRFYQIDYGQSRKYGGTGLGLAICKSYIELMGGSIWVNSVEGKGSTFHFTIPFRTREKQGQQGVVTGKFSENNILVAEDEDYNFLYLNELLKITGAKVFHAKNGREAVEYCKNFDMDLILMDIKMPVMDGLDATREIKKFKESVPVIALTAYAFDHDKQKALSAGCDDFMLKPFEEEHLMALMEKFIK